MITGSTNATATVGLAMLQVEQSEVHSERQAVDTENALEDAAISLKKVYQDVKSTLQHISDDMTYFQAAMSLLSLVQSGVGVGSTASQVSDISKMPEPQRTAAFEKLLDQATNPDKYPSSTFSTIEKIGTPGISVGESYVKLNIERFHTAVEAWIKDLKKLDNVDQGTMDNIRKLEEDDVKLENQMLQVRAI
jgi:hypothetical protein